MALLICPDCSGKVSEHAKACPHCGCPISYIKANLMEQANNISTEKIPIEMTDGNIPQNAGIDSLSPDGKKCIAIPKSIPEHDCLEICNENRDNLLPDVEDEFDLAEEDGTDIFWDDPADDVDAEDVEFMRSQWASLLGGCAWGKLSSLFDGMSKSDSISFDDLESNSFEAKSYEYEDY